MFKKIKNLFFNKQFELAKNNSTINHVDEKFSRVVKILENEYALKKTIEMDSCLDKMGSPIPWYTYPAIEYIKQLDFSQKRIFEFGSGNSSLYWASVAREVVSVEDNKKWYESRNKLKKNNMELLYRKVGEGYSESILQKDGSFDVIIVDAKVRDKCCEAAIKKLSNGGLIILDNSERSLEYEEYSNSVKILKNANLIQVDFCGLGPINDYAWATSFFFSRDFDFKSINDPIQPANIIGQI